MKTFYGWIRLLALAAWVPWVVAPPALGSSAYVRDVRTESPTVREARHRRVVERRAGPIVIVHRGASAMAPENSLEAYSAAMDYGADGCEIDLRRTRDGVLVLFHDDMLDHVLDEVGEIRELTFAELTGVRPRLRRGRVLPCSGPPTLAALLELARTRAMLLHLDVKEPGLEEAIAALFDRADAWDHVVSVNAPNATNLLRHPRLHVLPYKTGLYEGRRDLDPEAVRAALPGPGEMIIVDAPRVAARALHRAPYRPRPLSKNLYLDPRPETGSPLPVSSDFNLHAFCHSLGTPSRDRAVSLLASEFPEATQPDGDAAYRRWRLERIAERAWAARAAGVKRKTPRLVALLESQLRHRSLHPDWRYHGLEGVMASDSLVRLHAIQSVPALIEAFRRIDPDLRQVVAPQWGEYPLAWRDFRLKMTLLPALGRLDCPASRGFLLDYVAMDADRVHELAPPQFEEATLALFSQDLTGEQMRALLGHGNPAVRGTAILECLDRPTRRRTQALKAVARWALELPRARLCPTTP